MTNIIKIVPNQPRDIKKKKAIAFMENLIQDLKKNKIDPEKILIFVKWVNEVKSDGTAISESYEYYDNIECTENLLGCTDLLRHRILSQTVER